MKAACIMPDMDSSAISIPEGTDTVLALACNLSAKTAELLFGPAEIINPVRTLGTGYRDRCGRFVILDAGNERALENRSGFGPYLRTSNH